MDNYRVVVRPASEGDGYVARAPELVDCEAHGATRAEAVEALEQEIAAQLANMRDAGVEPPRPIDLQDFDGKLNLQISADLHRELTFAARDVDVELPQLLVELLARGISATRRPLARERDRADGSRGRDPRGREQRGRGPHGQRYHDIMENRADFIEYVRSLDGDGAGGGSGGRRRGGGGRR